MSVLYSSTVLEIFVFFFFSSRRRHTRFDCDWSSDVCSSDLARPPTEPAVTTMMPRTSAMLLGSTWPRTATSAAPARMGARPEERRVGKECRSRGSPYHEKKKQQRA